MTTNNHAMWAERHRPKTLDECVLEILPDSQQRWLKSISQTPEPLPNILFYGPPGTGKTTMARILADKEHYCVNHYNGSLLVKSDVDKMKDSITTVPLFGTHRIFFIDEADGMSDGAQYALRSIMEMRGSIASWLMTCNYKKELIEPLRSRLMQFEVSFPPRAEQARHIQGLIRRCQQILRMEGIQNVSDESLLPLVERSYPDVRQVVNNLQVEYERPIAA